MKIFKKAYSMEKEIAIDIIKKTMQAYLETSQDKESAIANAYYK
jgi:hypothetical protein